MIFFTFLIIATVLFVSFLYISYLRLITYANGRFEAWENVLEQQSQLLHSIAEFLETPGRKEIPSSQLKKLIAATQQLIHTEEAHITATAAHQQHLMETVVSTIEKRPKPIEVGEFVQWLTYQDQLIAAIDDLYLARAHYNALTKQYNDWRNTLWVYWMADSLKYTEYPLIPLSAAEQPPLK